MKKIFITMAALLGSMEMMGQNPYEAYNYATQDLNGSARYVGMGGALAALGGDVTVMSTNPAGTGMMKKTDLSFTASAVIGGTKGVLGKDKAMASVDQLGLVVAIPTYSLEGMTFGINVLKNKNHFLNIDTDISGLDGVYSQTWQIADLATQALYGGGWGALADMSIPIYTDNSMSEGILEPVADEDDEIVGYEGVGAQDAHYQRTTYGSTMEIDMNLAANIDNRFFVGATLGIYDVESRRSSRYEELGTNGDYYDFNNYYDTRGTGFDFKVGAIIRPVEESPFRLGFYIHTPIWYSLEDVNGSTLYLNDSYIANADYDPYQYKLRTPWKFGVSAGTTVGNYFAIGAEYVYQDLSSCKYSLRGSGTTNYLEYQNEMMENVLKAQHTFKVGMEVKPSNEFSVRCGYNYISAPMKEDGYNRLACDGVFTETDYTNWKATNRFTMGLGYRYKGGYVDLTYQYSKQEGDFYPFDVMVDGVLISPTKIENVRSQVMCTIGFRF